MSDDGGLPDLPAGAVADAQQAFQEWQTGNQPGALSRIQARADADEPWAVALLVWLFTQQGIPSFPQAMPYAKRASELGMPWVPFHLFNNMVGNIASNPQLLEPVLELAELTAPGAWGIDPVGNAWNLLQQGQPEPAVRLMGLSSAFGGAPWTELLQRFREQQTEIDVVGATILLKKNELDDTLRENEEAISKARAELETKAKQAGLLVSAVNAGSSQKLFDDDAARNERESQIAWRLGIGVLAVAACVAALPLVLHYFGMGPDYKENALLGAHAAATLALGAVAGVLLAKARARDRAHQRARDLSTAMGTMISYSNQIQDEAEKQRFMLTMGQLVLQAHLQSGDSHTKEDSYAGMASLVNAMRTPPST